MVCTIADTTWPIARFYRRRLVQLFGGEDRP
jgi:hypothetical protein